MAKILHNPTLADIINYSGSYNSIPGDVRWQVKKQLFDKIGYKCDEKVEAFHKSNAKTKVVCAPARSSKSYSAGHDVIDVPLVPNSITWIVGPNYGLAEKEFRYIHEALVLKRDKIGLPKPKVCLTNPRSGQLYIKWPWGSVVECKTADRPDGLLGEQVDQVIYSEAAQLARGIRERYVYPRLMTTKGRELIPTTPSMGAEWVHDLFDTGMRDNDLQVESFTWDVRANPIYDMEEFELAKKRYGADNPFFREQYLGEWAFYAGLVYSQYNEDLHTIEPFDIPKSWPRIRGIDFGDRDPFVCLWAAIGPEGELYFYREYYCRESRPMKHHAQMIKELTGDERIVNTVADPSGAQSREDLSYEGICTSSAINDRQAGRMRMQEYLMPTPEGVIPHHYKDMPMGKVRDKWARAYFFSDMKETRREIKNFRWKEGNAKAHQENEKERTEGEDHAMDTARYMCMSRPSPFKNRAYSPENSFNGHLHRMARQRSNSQFIGA